MKELSGTARNYYLSETDSEWKPQVEIIIVVSEPSYRIGASEIVKERLSEHYRISTNRRGVAMLMKELMDIDKDLEKMELERAGKPTAVPIV